MTITTSTGTIGRSLYKVRRQFLECGKIVSTHGIRGEVKVQPWSDSPEYLLEYPRLYLDKGNTPFPVEQGRVHKGMLILKPEDCNDLDSAVKLRGKVLYLDRNDDPDASEGRFFVQDLLGLRVVDVDDGTEYGAISDVFFTGANDVYEITNNNGKKLLIPAIRDVVLHTDPDGGEMRIRPLKGLFDDAD